MMALEHFSQIGQGVRNLCFQACFAAAYHHITGERVTAGQVARATGTADGTFTDPSEIRRIFEHYDTAWRYQRPADMAWWRDRLKNDRLALALVHYGTLIGSTDDFAHFVLPVGIEDEFVWLHDPLQLYGPIKIPAHQFAAAIATPTPGNTFVEQAWAVEQEAVTVKRGMGYNVHASYVTDDAWAELLTTWERTKPGALLVLDSFNEVKGAARALEAADRLPETTIIYRRYIAGDNQQNYLSPAQWIAEYSGLRNTRVYCALNNEPHGPALNIADYHATVVREARKTGLRVSVGGFSVGSPDDGTIQAHAPMLRWMADNPGWAILDLHEYTRALWTVDFARDAKDPSKWPPVVHDGISLWLMGRFRRWLNYCDQIGIKRPQIVIGEWGWDRVQAVPPEVYGDTEGLHTCITTWQGWGFGDWEKYGADQLKAAWQAIYKPYREVLGVCFYQVCTEPNNWPTFNAWTAPRFRALTETGFDTMAVVTEPVVGVPAGLYTLNYPGGRVNVRSAANTGASVLATVGHGEPVDILSNDATYDGRWTWQQVRTGGVTGYMATKGGAWTFDPRTVDAEAWAMVKAARDQLTAALQLAGVE